jgi:hypothetical protein
MTFFRTTLMILAAFGCGTVTAAVFISRPIPAPDNGPSVADPSPPPTQAPAAAAPPLSPTQAPAAVAPSPPPTQAPAAVAPPPPPVQQPSPRSTASEPPPARTIPIDRLPGQEPQTTGAAASASTPNAAQNPVCNQTACSRTYRSFDSSSCTYQPYDGGQRRLCEK